MRAIALATILVGCGTLTGPTTMVRQSANDMAERVNAVSDGIEGLAPIIQHACSFVKALKDRQDLKDACEAAEFAYRSSSAAVLVAHRAIRLYDETGIMGAAIDRSLRRVEDSATSLRKATDFLVRTVEHELDRMDREDSRLGAREGTGASRAPPAGESAQAPAAGGGGPQPAVAPEGPGGSGTGEDGP